MLGRPFMARFGEIARIEAVGGDVRVTLKSGTVFDLDRFEASDFDDGVRVWDGQGGVVDLDSLQVRSIELLPAPAVPGVRAVHRSTGCTARCARGRATSRAFCNGTAGKPSVRTSSTAAPPRVR